MRGDCCCALVCVRQREVLGLLLERRAQDHDRELKIRDKDQTDKELELRHEVCQLQSKLAEAQEHASVQQLRAERAELAITDAQKMLATACAEVCAVFTRK